MHQYVPKPVLNPMCFFLQGLRITFRQQNNKDKPGNKKGGKGGRDAEKSNEGAATTEQPQQLQQDQQMDVQQGQQGQQGEGQQQQPVCGDASMGGDGSNQGTGNASAAAAVGSGAEAAGNSNLGTAAGAGETEHTEQGPSKKARIDSTGLVTAPDFVPVDGTPAAGACVHARVCVCVALKKEV